MTALPAAKLPSAFCRADKPIEEAQEVRRTVRSQDFCPDGDPVTERSNTNRTRGCWRINKVIAEPTRVD